MKFIKYNLQEIRNTIDKAEDAGGLKEWYYPEAIAKLLFNQAVDKITKEMKDDSN